MKNVIWPACRGFVLRAAPFDLDFGEDDSPDPRGPVRIERILALPPQGLEGVAVLAGEVIGVAAEGEPKFLAVEFGLPGGLGGDPELVVFHGIDDGVGPFPS